MRAIRGDPQHRQRKNRAVLHGSALGHHVRPEPVAECAWWFAPDCGNQHLIISKLARADDGDLRDMEYLLSTHTSVEEVDRLLPSIVVPEVFSESWPRASAALAALLDRMR